MTVFLFSQPIFCLLAVVLIILLVLLVLAVLVILVVLVLVVLIVLGAVRAVIELILVLIVIVIRHENVPPVDFLWYRVSISPVRCIMPNFSRTFLLFLLDFSTKVLYNENAKEIGPHLLPL